MTHNTEVEELIEQLFQYYDDIDCAETVDQRITAKEQAELWLKRTLHHQLKKARQDWLREEIVRLGWMKTADYPSSLADPVGFTKCLSKNNTIQTIIDRYQAELDQDNK